MKTPAWLATTLLLTACAAAPPATTPMQRIAEPSERESDTLLVFLPGRGDRGTDFRTNGFLEIGAGRGFDMVAADAHFGYYMDRTIVERLHQDVILPARRQGYERIWLLGISAGGLGANLYTQVHPAMIDGLILLAPYPGDEALVADIAAAGSLATWSGQSEAGEAFQREAWRWLRDATAQPGQPMIVLGYGREDRFADANELLAGELPVAQVFRADGGHRWPVWRGLWQRIAAAGLPGGTTRTPD